MPQDLVSLLVDDPEEFQRQLALGVVAQIGQAAAEQQIADEWRKRNPDFASDPRLEGLVATKRRELLRENPALASDPVALLDQATQNIRDFAAKGTAQPVEQTGLTGEEAFQSLVEQDDLRDGQIRIGIGEAVQQSNLRKGNAFATGIPAALEDFSPELRRMVSPEESQDDVLDAHIAERKAEQDRLTKFSGPMIGVKGDV